MTTRIKLNSPGIEKLLKSPAVQRMLKKEADDIARRAGPGNEGEMFVGRNRARGTARTVTIEAMIAQQRHGALLKAVKPHR